MRSTFLTGLAWSAALAQLGQAHINRPVAVTVHLGADDTASFRLSQRVVTEIELHVGGVDYSVPLQCAGGLHDVDFGTVELFLEGDADHTFSLLFDLGDEQSRKFGKLPRVQIGFSRGRLMDMLVTTMTSERSAFSSKLCATVPIGRVTCKDTRQLQGLPPEVLVQQLRDLPTGLPAMARPSDDERRRRSIYEELLDWGPKSIPPLITALKDPDVRLRRNVALAFEVLNGGWWRFECGPATLDTREALPALIAPLETRTRTYERGLRKRWVGLVRPPPKRFPR